MQRYFSISKDEIILSKDDIHHIENVMRGRPHDTFEVVFNQKVYVFEITSTKPLAYKEVEVVDDNNELNNEIILFYCLSKGDKNEFVMQKATELGVNKIVLLSSSRSILKMSQDDFNKKKMRFEKIIKEASEQSKRNIVPEILGVYNINKIPEELKGKHNFVAYECDSGLTLNTLNHFNEIKPNERVSILIGSEGGLSKEEVSLLNKDGFISISLGKRILRTETAAVYALSVLGAILERR
jgi:16S rRNA (uracil1498-N3)-methyltransferase